MTRPDGTIITIMQLNSLKAAARIGKLFTARELASEVGHAHRGEEYVRHHLAKHVRAGYMRLVRAGRAAGNKWQITAEGLHIINTAAQHPEVVDHTWANRATFKRTSIMYKGCPERTCLRCREKFWPKHKGNYLCPGCGQSVNNESGAML